MSFLNTTEKKVAEDLFNAGFKKAAQSFSSISRQEINIEMTDVEVSRVWENNYHAHQGVLTLLTTDIIGELNGKSYLIFNQDECNTLYEACFPNKDDKNREMLEEAFLKELDNILSASMITEFSNFLQASIYGDVPGFCRDSAEKINHLIQVDFEQKSQDAESIFLIANTKFSLKNDLSFRPQFFWKLTDSFISMIKKVAEEKSA